MPAQTPRCFCPGAPVLGLAHPPAPLPARLSCGQKHPPPPRSFWPPSSPSVAAMGSFCAVAWRDGDRDRHGDGAGRCFPAQADRHSLTHRSWDGSWFQLCPPGAQSRLPAWVTMGTAGWGKPAPREVAEDEPPWGMVARATLLLGHQHGAAGVTVMCWGSAGLAGEPQAQVGRCGATGWVVGSSPPHHVLR